MDPLKRASARPALLGMLLLLSATQAFAGVIFTIDQVGGDVVIHGSGSYDLTGANLLTLGSQDGFINSGIGALAVGGPAQGVDIYPFTTNAGVFGTGGFLNGNPDSGDVFGLDATNLGGFITVPIGYVSGQFLSGSTTITGQSFATLGLIGGTYVYQIPNDTVTVQIPEPLTIGLFGLGLLGIGLAQRKPS